MSSGFTPWIDRLRPAGNRSALHGLLAVAGGVALIALGAQVDVPMYPVPMTLQTLAVVIVGALLGLRKAVATTTAYLAAGVLGLPVFAGWTAAPGAAFIELKSGGYVLGFILCAAAVAALTGRIGYRRPLALFAAMLAGHALVFLLGIPWLAAFIGLGPAVDFGLVPFIPGLIVKSALGVAVVALCERALPAGRRPEPARGLP
jgi:biotin transport system substrate-specific component